MNVNTVKKLDEYNDALTVEELRTVLRIGRTSAYKMVKNKTIKSIYIGNKIYIPKRYVKDFLHIA